jgi:hypothetical protein
MRGDGRAWWMMLATVVPNGTFVTWPGHDTDHVTTWYDGWYANRP